MNDRIKELAEQCGAERCIDFGVAVPRDETFNISKFAELLIEECRNVVSAVYRNTPLELCGPLLAVDAEIAQHFYGSEDQNDFAVEEK